MYIIAQNMRFTWIFLLLLWIDVSRGLVQHEYFIVPDQSSGQTNQLSLTHAEIRTVFGHFRVQTAGQTVDHDFQFHLEQKKKKLINIRSKILKLDYQSPLNKLYFVQSVPKNVVRIFIERV